jgi:NAD(P)-dependent dehydrogenase (short-subunit alcohol dehydrogenase family)
MDTNTPVALVTGAGRPTGLGVEVAAQLARQGYKIILTDVDAKAAAARASELSQQGLDITGRALDITSEAEVNSLVADIEREWGQLDVLVNNAALMGPLDERATSGDLHSAQQVLQVNLFGSWRLTRALLPLLRKSAHARVVNVSSGAGSHGDANFGLSTQVTGASYAVSKAALNALTVKIANEERPQRVLINAVCPGFTATLPGMQEAGARPVAEGAASVVWAALLADDGPTAGYFRDGKAIPW